MLVAVVVVVVFNIDIISYNNYHYRLLYSYIDTNFVSNSINILL